jgi:hypothetical protein
VPEERITLADIYNQLQTLTGRMNERFDSFETVQNAMAARLISVEARLEEHSGILDLLRKRVDALHGLVERLEFAFGRTRISTRGGICPHHCGA